ncbi:putative retroelement pol polyprotein [Cucumis melo var. makuwa]|uniref:Retroelement pol polyprotein n=1 Tax=Cucumis melo var. makuwa TaxID=1194695 RepID=A0A5D3DIX2_CUCMM|nr:putative retroelement pol polyprotein [Cucumis melo var. makuwa]TYK23584.1 putative retroelement pol polyprotein [Cucumis melo var. makuwa]
MAELKELEDQQSSKYLLQKDVLKYKDRLVITKTSSLIPAILETYHNSVVGGHSGFLRTYKRVSNDLYCEGMEADIKKHCEERLICQRNKSLALSPAGLLVPLEIPQAIWSDTSMDFVEGLPKASGFEVILVVVDRLSKYGHFLPLKHPFTAKLVAELFVKEVVRLHGFPLSIVSNRDKNFMSHFWRELFRLSGTKLNKSTAYHPQSDGQTEVVNRGVETYLRCFCSERPKEWVKWLAWIEYWYNTTFQRAIGMSPFQVVYGRKPPALLSYDSIQSKNSTVEEMLRDRDEILSALRDHLRLAQEQMKIMLTLSLRKKRNEKLSPKLFGPYKILEKVGSVAYKLQLPNTTAIHPVFHVSQLKKLVGPHENLQPTIQYINEKFEWKSVPEDVLEYRQNKTKQWEVLIKWEGLPQLEATWESYEEMQRLYPAFHLEDKIIPILRAGLALAEYASSVLPATKLYHLGISRDEETLQPTVYLNKLPENFPDGCRIFVVDPMLATGGTIVAALDLLKERGIGNKQIKVISAVAAPPALQKLSEKFPGLHIYTGIIDPTVNEKGFIIPGLGDAGDRSFGT